MSDRFFDIDLAISDDGDLMLSETKDLLTVEDERYVEQTVKNRLRSVASDWFYDNIGANLEEGIGRTNSEDTAKMLVDNITVALTKDKFCELDDILVVAKPETSTTLFLFTFINTPFSKTPMGFEIELNFLTGFEIRRT